MRSFSPSRGGEVNVADIDPEAVRVALRDFVQQLAGAERERDDALAACRSLSQQLKEMEEDRDRTEGRLMQLQRSLGECEEGKKVMSSSSLFTSSLCTYQVIVRTPSSGIVGH